MDSATPENADEVIRPASPYVRGPFERVRVAVCFDPEKGLTHQSFKDECDINNIVATYARTGIAPKPRGKPQFGVAPDADLFEAACVQAEIRSAEAEGSLPDAAEPESSHTASEAAGDEISENLGETRESTQKAASAASEASDAES